MPKALLQVARRDQDDPVGYDVADTSVLASAVLGQF
jgi:hypothetical protein